MVDGVSCPLLGRVTMDQIMVDVSRVPHPEPGMTVEIMGPNIPVTELAEKGRYHFLGNFYRNRSPGAAPLHPLNPLPEKRSARVPLFRAVPSFPIDGQPEISFIDPV